jgi:hypothetical protein
MAERTIGQEKKELSAALINHAKRAGRETVCLSGTAHRRADCGEVKDDKRVALDLI